MSKIVAGQVVDLSFHAKPQTAHPLLEAPVVVTVRAPSGREYDVIGFWNGGDEWRVRFCLDEPGSWSWKSDLGESRSGATSGSMEVGTYKGGNRLYRHGPLKIHESGRAFAHRDGEPFFWQADTAWAAPAHARKDEWTTYLARRSEQGFNVVQINALPQWDASGPPLRHPFRRRGANYDLRHIEPDYFRNLDEQVAAARDAGIVSAMVALWFNYVPGDNIDWPVERPGTFDPKTAAHFGRYLAARYGAYGVIWIVSGDSSFDDSAAIEVYDAMADALLVSSATPPLLTAHLNGGRATPAALNARPWLSFHMFQSCHFRDTAERARRYARIDGTYLPRRPIVNGEPCYDNLRIMDKDNTEAERFGRDDVRLTSWISILTGAAAGITYGCHAVWPWHRTGQEYGTIHYGLPKDWLDGLALESAADISRLSEFVSGTNWWTLEPCDGARAVAEGVPIEQAADSEGNLLLVFARRQTALQMPAILIEDRETFWFDPVSGNTSGAKVRDLHDHWAEVEAAPWPGDAVFGARRKQTPGGTGTAHVAVYTDDIRRSVDFYTGVLGLRVEFRSRLDRLGLDYALLSCGDCRVEILQSLPGQTHDLRRGLDHFAIEVADLDAFVSQIRARGQTFEREEIGDLPELFRYGARGIFLKGPDGERIELFETVHR